MKRKTGISLMLALLMIVSAFSAVNAAQVGKQKITPDYLTEPIDVDKKVWNGTDWADELVVKLGEMLRFNITITYNKHCQQGIMATDIIVIDELSPGLDYIGNANYIESWINGNQIYWNLTEDHNINLTDGQSISIEFDALIIDNDNVYVSNYAEVSAWEFGSSGCYLFGYDSVLVEVIRPIDVSKKVWDGTNWVEEINAQPEEIIRFNITITYNKNCQQGTLATNIVVIDELPQGLEFNGNSTYMDSWVDDNIVYWSLTQDHDINLTDGESVSLEFDAIVKDYGELSNFAKVYALEIGCNDWTIYGDDQAMVYVTETQPIDVSKKVWNGSEWADEINAQPEEIVRFNITITYHKNCQQGIMATDILVIDELSPSLDYIEDSATYNESWINGDLIYWNLTEDHDINLTDGQSVSIEFDAYITDYGDFYNYVEVLAWEIGCSDWYLYGDDYALVKVEEPPPLLVEKEVYDPETGQWVDELLGTVKKDDPIKFRITITYNGYFNVNLMKDMIVEDFLPACGLEYAGNEIFTYTEPDLFDDPEITVSQDLKHVTYDWTDKLFNLFVGESIVIEFETNVVEYCYDTVENCAYVDLWNWPFYLFDSDCATVNCFPPESSFEKKVKDSETGEWVEETNAFVGDTVRFKIELTYYGNYNLTEINIVDQLPCSLEYAYNANPPETNVSEDLKTIWWEFTEALEDGEKLEIQFDVLAIDVTGCGSGTNIATVTAYEQQDPFSASDTAEVSIDINNPPSAPGITGDTYGEVGDILAFSAKTTDPDGDDVYYMFDWGDGSQSDWLGPLPSGEDIEATNSWDTAGEYKVKAKAKDSFGKESEWSYYPLIVKIEEEEPEKPELEVTIKRGFSRSISVYIENTGEVDADDITWNLTITKRGLLKRTILKTNGTIPTLGVGLTETVEESPFGFGLITVTVEVTAPDIDPIQKTAKGFIFLRFVRLRKFL